MGERTERCDSKYKWKDWPLRKGNISAENDKIRGLLHWEENGMKGQNPTVLEAR